MTIQDAGLQLLSMGNMTIYKESLIQSMKQLDSLGIWPELKLIIKISKRCRQEI